MTRRCDACHCTLASDNSERRCAPCQETYGAAVSHLASWLQRFTHSEITAYQTAEVMIRSVSVGGRDGEQVRARVLRVLVGDSDPNRGATRRTSLSLPPSPTRPAPRRDRDH